MTDENHSLWTRGQLIPGTSQQDVRQKLATFTKYPPQTLDRIFSGRPFCLKTSLDQAMLKKYQDALDNFGLVTWSQPVDQESTTIGLKKDLSTMSCPKCGHTQKKAISCESCGIVIQKYRDRDSLASNQAPLSSPTSAPRSFSKPSSSTKSPLLLLSQAGVILGLLAALYIWGPSLFAGFSNDDVVLFTDYDCPPCNSAKDYLDARGVTYTELNIRDMDENRSRYDRYGSRTLPLLLINGEEIFGFHPTVYTTVITGLKNKLNGVVDNDVVMYSAKGCGQCNRARQYFEQNSIPFNEYFISDSQHYSDYKSYFPIGTPLIFVGNIRMDGFSKEGLDLAFRQVGRPQSN